MFLYCGNNPVNNIDPSGNSWLSIAAICAFVVVACAVAVVAAPVIAAAAAGSGIIIGISAIASAAMAIGTVATGVGVTACVIGMAQSIPKTISKTQTKENEKRKKDKDAVIYRYGGTNPGNFVPTIQDVATNTGLSFSTIPKPGAAMTTIGTLNATGIVYAVQDSLTHVSVRPVGATVMDWRNAGSSSIWTVAVKSVVVKWDGGN